MSWLFNLAIPRVWVYAAAAATVVGAIVLLLARTRERGRQAERIDRALINLKVRDAQIKAAADAPRGRAAVSARLRGDGL